MGLHPYSPVRSRTSCLPCPRLKRRRNDKTFILDLGRFGCHFWVGKFCYLMDEGAKMTERKKVDQYRERATAIATAIENGEIIKQKGEI